MKSAERQAEDRQEEQCEADWPKEIQVLQPSRCRTDSCRLNEHEQHRGAGECGRIGTRDRPADEPVGCERQSPDHAREAEAGTSQRGAADDAWCFIEKANGCKRGSGRGLPYARKVRPEQLEKGDAAAGIVVTAARKHRERPRGLRAAPIAQRIHLAVGVECQGCAIGHKAIDDILVDPAGLGLADAMNEDDANPLAGGG